MTKNTKNYSPKEECPKHRYAKVYEKKLLNRMENHLLFLHGFSVPFDDIMNEHDFEKQRKRYALEKRITPVVVIDEADMLTHKILSDLQIMFNFEIDSRNLAVILLIGQLRLNTTLNQSAHEAYHNELHTLFFCQGMIN